MIDAEKFNKKLQATLPRMADGKRGSIVTGQHDDNDKIEVTWNTDKGAVQRNITEPIARDPGAVEGLCAGMGQEYKQRKGR